jgi:putative pyoverdin transport system ATP-binding/permease protein
MNLFDFLKAEIKTSPYPLIIMATFGGLVNGALLSAFSSISSSGDKGPELHSILLITTTMVMYYYSKKYTLLRSMTIMEEMINSIRKRVVGKLRYAELASFERLDNSKIYTLLTQEVNMLSQSVNAIVYAFQSAIIVLFCLIFIGINSIPTLLVMLLAFVLGGFTYMKIRKEADTTIRDAILSETSFFTALGQILDGFKELKLHTDKDKSVFHSYTEVTRNLQSLNLRVGKLFSWNFVYTQSYFYGLIGVVVFLLPSFAHIDNHTATSVTIATLFMISPLMMSISALPEFSRANIAINNLYKLEAELQAIGKETPNGLGGAHYYDFTTITFNSLQFHYPPAAPDEPPYTVGEIDLSLNAGEILFIVGGNGSGKTTLLKLITGLYQADSGTINLDDKTIGPAHIHAYRELFTGVFADYHLFDKLYGVDKLSDKQVADLIVRMELEDKTAYHNGRFTNLRLSQGQRRRLGLIVSLLEDKPIYIFDEWAADQDPHFKKFFYQELLQDLKARGKTIIVISHDDRYFKFADRVITMDYGKIIDEKVL